MSGRTAWGWVRTGIRGLTLAVAGLTQWLPGAVMASVAALTVALWLWAGTAGSLRQALAVATPFVPELEGLDWTELDATLRDGGRADQLTWQQDGLTVVVDGPRFGWQFLPLLLGQPLALELRTDAIRVTDQRPTSPAPLTPPDDLALPVAVALDLDLGPLFWTDHPKRTPTPLTQRLRGHYTHGDNDNGDEEHHLQLTELVAAQGRYRGDVRLQSTEPLALSARLQGTVTSAPSAPASTLALAIPAWQAEVSAQVTGELHSPQATLAVTAQVHSPAPGPQAELQASVQPWQNQPLLKLNAQLHRLDLATFWAGLPHTQLSGQAQAGPVDGAVPQWAVSATLANATPGTWDQQRLPVSSLALQAQGNTGAGQLTHFKASAGNGLVDGSGSWQGGTWQGKLQAQGVRLADLDTRLPHALLNASLQTQQRAAGAKRPNTPSTPTPTATTVATLEAVATALPGGKNSNSKQFISIKRQATFSSKFSWNGQRLALDGLKLGLDNASLHAQGTLTPRTQDWDGEARLLAPGLQASSQGRLGPDAGQGQLNLAVDDGTALARWLGGLPVVGQALGLAGGTPMPSGQGQATVQWDGGWRSPTLQLDAKAALQQLTVPATAASPTWGAQALALALNGTAAQWQASASGQLHRDTLGAQLAVSLSGQTPGLLATPAEPVSPNASVTVSQLAVALGPRKGPAALRVDNPRPLSVAWRAGTTSLAAGALRLHPMATGTPAVIDWQASTWGAAGLSTTGQFSNLAVHPWAQVLSQLGTPAAHNALKAAGLGGDLALQGEWQLAWPGLLTQPPQGRLAIARQSGDLRVDDATLPTSTDPTPPTAPRTGGTALALGLTQASLELRTQGESLTLLTQWDSARAGRVKANWATRLTPGPHTSPQGWLPQRNAPLSGQAQADMPDIAVWSRLAPPGWRVKGQLGLSTTVGGSLGQPDWRGELRADALELRSVVEGLAFGNGTLRATLGGDRAEITEFRLEGEGGAAAGGSLQLTGSAHWPAAEPGATPPPRSVALQATAQRLRVSARADRRLTVSGQATAQLSQSLLTLRGKLKADQAQFVLPDETAPSLGTDVVVRLARAAPPPPASVPMRTDVALQIDLGPQFEVQGQGLQTRLSGELAVTSPPRSDGFQVVGEVRAVNGTYRAYGQPLRIEDGVLRFSGPYDDPGLEVLALRGKATPGGNARLSGNTADNQQVGVKITGSARAPRVALYASPDLPDSEKLAWLVLGRPASGVGAETAVLQQAALALLADSNGRGMDTNLALALGLDDISLRGNTTQSTDGSTSQTAALTLGKRLSSKLYVTYEQSLNSAMGAVNLFYDVSRRLTVRAQAGQTSALDLIFTLQHD